MLPVKTTTRLFLLVPFLVDSRLACLGEADSMFHDALLLRLLELEASFGVRMAAGACREFENSSSLVLRTGT